MQINADNRKKSSKNNIWGTEKLKTCEINCIGNLWPESPK